MGIPDIESLTRVVGSFGVAASDDCDSVPLMKNVSIHTKIILWCISL